jgi:antitoxin (DNA-binding transcriptional repressor) of toxin-antitoxin stability system
VNVAELKNSLSKYLTFAKGGEEVVIRDRNLPVAKLVRELATQSLDKYSLRASDSLQLASSLIWCEQRPSRRSFICGDHRLAEAAESTGFSVLELS